MSVMCLSVCVCLGVWMCPQDHGRQQQGVATHSNPRGIYASQVRIQYTEESRGVEFEYRTTQIDVNYNGSGLKGTGGPKLEWLASGLLLMHTLSNITPNSDRQK